MGPWRAVAGLAIARAAPHGSTMDGLPELLHPQLLAGCLALALLGLALTIELRMLALALHRPATASAEPEPGSAEATGLDFYDWIYE